MRIIKNMKLRVPYFKQTTNVFCAPACAQMILKFFGKPFPSQEALAKIMRTDLVGEEGTKHGMLADYLRSKRLIVRVTRESSLLDVEKALAKGLPPIVHYIEPSEEDDHYAVVVGLTKTHITLNDPWNGKDFSFTRSEFQKRWRDNAGIYTRWLLVARPK